ncbi:MAG: Malate:quinone oxidoreductase (EC [uncultured Thiotrichaceae bacterium]|uniref:Probable malate:quinone oxidoreductase n=1 Tax=uncultured Thiotrichaceae bacterium TaxID=298394 RepID=A0A6S6U4L0_9GAMM|nr:MAG: Malate:quinone oxidoreductase (EC [uncultured Thiotrichaceae bacterium]
MEIQKTDILLVGAGIMSATLATMLKQLNPDFSITIVERLSKVAGESTSGWNNAGTGHAAYCELNYTAEQSDGSIEIAKALKINRAFETTLQFWSYLIGKELLPSPENFINQTPHIGFVWGEDNVKFMKKRYDAMTNYAQFSDMEYSEDPAVLAEWMPLVMEGRDPSEKVAATRITYGSDVDFGSVTEYMVDALEKQEGFRLILDTDVVELKRDVDRLWKVEMENNKSGLKLVMNAGFVFLGSGGGALPLLQNAGVEEVDGYAGFPVSGQWLVCRTPEVVEKHWGKVYGKASIGAPPMSVPHLDTRILDGEKALLFGPFAGFTMRFLKEGSWTDMIRSVRPNNFLPIMAVGLRNFALVRYLIKEALQGQKARMKSLRNYFPNAKDEHWDLAHAGQRVQIIKKDPNKIGKLEFGTEVLTTQDKTLSALLGASPGASVAVAAMIEVLEDCFPDQMALGGEWRPKLAEMIESQGYPKGHLSRNDELLKYIRQRNLDVLGLKA